MTPKITITLKRRISLLVLTLALAVSPVAAAQSQKSSANEGNVPANLPAAQRAQRKLQWIAVNGERRQPNITPTEMSEQEINAYFAAGLVRLPKGVHQVRFSGDVGQVTADTNVDFDEIKEGRGSANPLLMVFSGTHAVKVVATAQGRAGQGTVHVQSVEIDGMEVPRMALEFFVERYLTPKYPGVGLDSTFALPDRIQTAVVGRHVLTIVQK